MNLEQIREVLPDYAKDVRLNLGAVLTPEGAPDLAENQIFAIALASAYAAKNELLANAILSEGKLADNEIEAAKASATIMGMNNIYYRFIHLVSDKEYGTMSAKLRMNVIGSSGVNKKDFELYSLAVSAINGCGMCIDSHARALEKHGVTKVAIQSSIRIAAVINSVAQALFIK